MNLASKIVLIVIIGGVFSTSCRKNTCKEVIPEMTYSDFYQNLTPDHSDSGSFFLLHKFNDCDGDIGMESTSTIFDENGEVQTTNLKIDLYYTLDGQWIMHIFDSGDGLNSKIPVLSTGGDDPILDGEIQNRIDIYSINIPTPYVTDTIMFKSRILDNAGHYSNIAESPAFIINY